MESEQMSGKLELLIEELEERIDMACNTIDGSSSGPCVRDDVIGGGWKYSF